jgi:hypothetical protein
MTDQMADDPWFGASNRGFHAAVPTFTRDRLGSTPGIGRRRPEPAGECRQIIARKQPFRPSVKLAHKYRHQECLQLHQCTVGVCGSYVA